MQKLSSCDRSLTKYGSMFTCAPVLSHLGRVRVNRTTCLAWLQASFTTNSVPGLTEGTSPLTEQEEATVIETLRYIIYIHICLSLIHISDPRD